MKKLMCKKFLMSVLVASWVGAVFAGGPVEMVLYGLSGKDREDDWKSLREELLEKGVTVESTDVARARVVVAYDEELLFPKRNPKVRLRTGELEKRIGQVVRESTISAFDLRPVSGAGFESGYVEREVRIGVLDCKGCRYGAYSIAMRVEGVERVWIDAERSVLRFAYDPRRVGRIYSAFFEPSQIVNDLVRSALRKGRVEVTD